MSRRHGHLGLAALLSLALSAATPAQDDGVPADAIVPPPEPFATCDADDRPAACTQQYDPVCGAVDTGLRCVTTPCDSTRWDTFGNACSACATPGVIGWRAGTCTDG